MPFFNYNGKLFADGEPVISANNRGLRYGDGLFETMKMKEGGIILPDEHFARLWKGMQLMQFDIPKLWSPAKFEEQFAQLSAKNKLSAARIRLTVVRGNGGLYDAANTPNYIIEATALPESNAGLNINGIQLCIYKDAQKAIDRFSNLKHNNCLPYLMGAMFAKQQHCNDALILNSKGNICEATIANVFLIKDDLISTPSLSEGCIAGVTRKCLIDKMREQAFNVQEVPVTIEDVLNADEIFLTNSISPLRWVSALGEKSYSNVLTQKIVFSLTNNYPEIFA